MKQCEEIKLQVSGNSETTVITCDQSEFERSRTVRGVPVRNVSSNRYRFDVKIVNLSILRPKYDRFDVDLLERFLTGIRSGIGSKSTIVRSNFDQSAEKT